MKFLLAHLGDRVWLDTKPPDQTEITGPIEPWHTHVPELVKCSLEWIKGNDVPAKIFLSNVITKSRDDFMIWTTVSDYWIEFEDDEDATLFKLRFL